MNSHNDTPSALILLAPGCEEMEAVITIDILRRAGVRVTAAGIAGGGELIASREVRLVPDVDLDALEDANSFSALILPGGMPGTEALREDLRVRDLLRHYAAREGVIVATICAAALVLDAYGLLEGKRFTCYPTFAPSISGGTFEDSLVVEDGELVTSQGPGTAMAFALTLVERLTDQATRDQVAAGLLFQ